MKRVKMGSRVRRLREHVLILAAQMDLRCWICGERIALTRDADVPRSSSQGLCEGSSADGLTWHHRNGDRTDDTPDNLVLCHSSCHRRYERSMAEKKVDVRTKRAKRLCGLSPKGYKSTETREPGSMLPGLTEWLAENRPETVVKS